MPYLIRKQVSNILFSCDYLTIGDGNKEKRAIFLTSRVHPGETMSSYIIEYIIDFLLGNSALAKNLRENFVFKIVPMLNIDGVIVGNYRCNLSGADLNRQYIEPSKKAHPTIYYTKQVIFCLVSSSNQLKLKDS